MKNLLILSLISAFSFGCGSSGSGGGNGGGIQPGNKHGQPVDCSSAWTQMVNANPKGLEKTYNVTTENQMGGTQKHTEKETVIESSDAKLVIKTSMNGSNSQTVTFEKQEFLKMCQSSGGVDDSFDGNVQIIATRDENVTVAAGTFFCSYVKTKSVSNENGMDMEFITESWTTKSDNLFIPVLTRSTQTMKYGDQTVTSQSTRELVKLKRP